VQASPRLTPSYRIVGQALAQRTDSGVLLVPPSFRAHEIPLPPRVGWTLRTDRKSGQKPVNRAVQSPHYSRKNHISSQMSAHLGIMSEKGLDVCSSHRMAKLGVAKRANSVSIRVFQLAEELGVSFLKIVYMCMEAGLCLPKNPNVLLPDRLEKKYAPGQHRCGRLSTAGGWLARWTMGVKRFEGSDLLW
jgi:hypothetical protein